MVLGGLFDREGMVPLIVVVRWWRAEGGGRQSLRVEEEDNAKVSMIVQVSF